MKIKIEFNCDNAAFQDGDTYGAIAEVIREIADKVENQQDSSGIYDANGHSIGKWAITGY